MENEIPKLAERGVFIAHYDVDAVFAGATLRQDQIEVLIRAANQAQRSNAILNTGITLTLEVQGCSFGGGKMVLVAQPVSFLPFEQWGSSNSTRYEMLGLHNVDNLPHVYVDPSTTATYELTLPLVSPTLRYDTIGVGPEVRWVIRFFHMVPPVSGTAAAFDAHATLFARYTNSAQYGAIVPLSVEEIEKGGAISGVVEGASSILEYATGVFPSLAPFTRPFVALSGPFAKILRYFGFAKPLRDDVDLDVLNRFNDSHCHVDGLGDSYNLGYLTHPNMAIDDGYTGGKHEDMLLSNICAKRSYIDSLDITQASSSGTLVFSSAVTPAVRYWYSNTSRGLHPAAFIARLFQGWKGEMTFRFHFIGSVFHRASVVIAYSPDPNAVAPTMNQAIAYLYHKKVALSGNVEVDFKIPYVSSSLWKNWRSPVNTNPRNVVNAPIGSLGNVYVFVMNPVETNGSSDPYRLLVSATFDKMSFGLPVATRTSTQMFNTVALSQENIELLNANALSFPEVIGSTKELASIATPRTLIPSTFAAQSEAVLLSTYADLHPKHSALGTSWLNSFADYLAVMYLGYRGSLKLSLMMEHGSVTTVGNPMSSSCVISYLPQVQFPVSTFTGSTRSSPQDVQRPFFITKASAMVDSALTPTVDVSIPAHYAEAYQQVSPQPFTRYFVTARWAVPLGTTATQTANVRPFVSAGDDFTWGMFLGTPVESDNV